MVFVMNKNKLDSIKYYLSIRDILIFMASRKEPTCAKDLTNHVLNTKRHNARLIMLHLAEAGLIICKGRIGSTYMYVPSIETIQMYGDLNNE